MTHTLIVSLMMKNEGAASKGTFVWAVVVPSPVNERVVLNTHSGCFTAPQRNIVRRVEPYLVVTQIHGRR